MYFFVSDINSTIVRPPFSDHFFAMRVQKGKVYGICDQKGSMSMALIEYVDKKDKSVVIKHQQDPVFESNTRQGILYHALVDRQYQEKLCEVFPLTNFTKLIFVNTDQSSPQQPSFERLNGIIQRSCSQCQTLWRPELDTQIINFDSVISKDVTVLNSAKEQDISNHYELKNTCFIGPEGGWSEEEQKVFTSQNQNQVFYQGVVYPAWISGLVYSAKISSLDSTYNNQSATV